MKKSLSIKAFAKNILELDNYFDFFDQSDLQGILPSRVVETFKKINKLFHPKFTPKIVCESYS